jgi:hypothetical protein
MKGKLVPGQFRARALAVTHPGRHSLIDILFSHAKNNLSRCRPRISFPKGERSSARITGFLTAATMTRASAVWARGDFAGTSRFLSISLRPDPPYYS